MRNIEKKPQALEDYFHFLLLLLTPHSHPKATCYILILNVNTLASIVIVTLQDNSDDYQYRW